MTQVAAAPLSAVLITGASSGIGAALAHEYAQRGRPVALLARRTEQLSRLAETLRALGATVAVHTGDVTRDGDVGRCVQTLMAHGWRIDTVIANAGFTVAGTLPQLSLADYRRQFETNVFGVLRTVYESLPALRESRGRLVIMGSIAGHVAAPGASAYAMSKFAVRALADSLRGDLRGEGIAVTLISPGFIDSDIRRTDNRGEVHSDAPDPLPRWARMRTAHAARLMARGIAAGRDEIVITFHGKVIVWTARHFPGLVHALVRHYVRWRRAAASRRSDVSP
jgi:short-subunit dehydrogenase